MISFIKSLLGGSGANTQTLIAQGAKVIDVRSKAEFASGHFKGSVNIPLDQIEQKASALKKEQAYVLCCRSGMRSGSATSKLKAMGFTNVHNGGSWTSLRKHIRQYHCAMKSILISLTFICGLTLLSFTYSHKQNDANHEQTAAIVRDTPQQFSDAMNGGNFILLDVRTANEVAKGRIAGSIHIDWFADDFAAQVAKLDKSKIMLVYCGVGGRSEEACELLIKQGFAHVHNLEGGIKEWKNVGYPVVK